MPSTKIHTLIGPYLLDALPADERVSFEQHLVDCPECAVEVTESCAKPRPSCRPMWR